MIKEIKNNKLFFWLLGIVLVPLLVIVYAPNIKIAVNVLPYIATILGFLCMVLNAWLLSKVCKQDDDVSMMLTGLHSFLMVVGGAVFVLELKFFIL